MPVANDWVVLPPAESSVLDVKVLLLPTTPKLVTEVRVLCPLELMSSPVEELPTVVFKLAEDDSKLVFNNDVGSSALDAVLDAVPGDVVEVPLPSCDPVAVMDWLPELSCEVWLVSVEIEVSDDVPLCESLFMPAIRLLVDSCDDEVRVPESDPLELVPVVVPPCELLGLKVDVDSPLLVESCDAEVCVP